MGKTNPRTDFIKNGRLLSGFLTVHGSLVAGFIKKLLFPRVPKSFLTHIL
jgi:hypothetical protein